MNHTFSYLVQRVHHGQVAQQRYCKGLCQQVSAQQVNIELMILEICASHKRLCQQPVVVGISGKEDGILG